MLVLWQKWAWRCKLSSTRGAGAGGAVGGKWSTAQRTRALGAQIGRCPADGGCVGGCPGCGCIGGCPGGAGSCPGDAGSCPGGAACGGGVDDDDVRVCSGFKGYSKGGNYGEVVPPPRRLDTATASASGTLALRPFTPYARGPTEDEIAEWMERFEALPATPYPIEVGNVVLWRGFKKGKKEGASTSEEFFRCTGSSRMTGTGRDIS